MGRSWEYCEDRYVDTMKFMDSADNLWSRGHSESSVALAFVVPHAGRAKSHTLRIWREAVKHLKSV